MPDWPSSKACLFIYACTAHFVKNYRAGTSICWAPCSTRTACNIWSERKIIKRRMFVVVLFKNTVFNWRRTHILTKTDVSSRALMPRYARCTKHSCINLYYNSMTDTNSIWTWKIPPISSLNSLMYKVEALPKKLAVVLFNVRQNICLSLSKVDREKWAKLFSKHRHHRAQEQVLEKSGNVVREKKIRKVDWWMTITSDIELRKGGHQLEYA